MFHKINISFLKIYFKKRDIDLVEHIKTRIIFILNENEMQYDIPYWVNGIKQ
jgi:hypothetical protein